MCVRDRVDHGAVGFFSWYGWALRGFFIFPGTQIWVSFEFSAAESLPGGVKQLKTIMYRFTMKHVFFVARAAYTPLRAI